MKEKLVFIFAMQREADMVRLPEDDNIRKEIVGISMLDNLPQVSEDEIIINLGYCGSNSIKVGTIVEPSIATDLRTGAQIKLDHLFDTPTTECFTSDEFVTKSTQDEPCVYDMELYKIAQLPHKALYSLKIVSDNLNLEDCEKYNDETAWEKCLEILNDKLKDKFDIDILKASE